MRLNACFNEIAPIIGPLQLLSRVVALTTGMAKREVSPQEERKLTRKMLKCWPLRDMGFLKISSLLVLCVECNRRHLYLCRIVLVSGVSYTDSGRRR